MRGLPTGPRDTRLLHNGRFALGLTRRPSTTIDTSRRATCLQNRKLTAAMDSNRRVLWAGLRSPGHPVKHRLRQQRKPRRSHKNLL